MRAMLLAAVAIAGAFGCANPKDVFECSGNAACRNGSVQGACEETGYCSFPDTGCTSGSRYGEIAGDGLAGQCVDPGADPLGAWTDAAMLPAHRYSGAGVTIGDRVYYLGGILGSTPYATVSIGQFTDNPINGGELSWTDTTAMPDVRRAHAAVTDGSWIYVLGGRTSTDAESASVISAPVNPDGSLGAWQSTTPLPAGLRCPAAVAWNDHVYVIGGKTAGAKAISDVLVATMKDGAIGAWQNAGSVPTARACLAAAAVNGYLYVIGGCSKNMNGCQGQILSDVQVSKINADGSLGAFAATTPLPMTRWHHSVAVTADHLAVIGGKLDASQDTMTTATTHINSDGSLGAWRAGTDVDVTTGRQVAAVLGNYVFLIGISSRVASFQ